MSDFKEIINNLTQNHQKEEEKVLNENGKPLSANNEQLIDLFRSENSALINILKRTNTFQSFTGELKNWAHKQLSESENALKFYEFEYQGRESFEKLSWREIGLIRLLDYIEYGNLVLEDPNLRGEKITSDPLKVLWDALKNNVINVNEDFFVDILFLFRQINEHTELSRPDKEQLEQWMQRHPSGLDDEIINLREANKKRLIDIFISKIDNGTINDKRFFFENEKTYKEKFNRFLQWWNDRLFHLRFAVRDPDLLNEMLDNTLSGETMDILYQARDAGIPFFVNPYYLSLLNVKEPKFAKNSDLAIRQYILYSEQLIEEYGHINAWEKEDIVEEGKPNAAGYLLPGSHNIHRRYPEVAILIPDTIGRACGGLCASCQRMYDFQSGHLNFDLDKLKPRETWPEKLKRLLQYFRNDSQLRDILITGGDALMSSDRSLKRILDGVYQVAKQKIDDNKQRKKGEKYAEMLRVRLGTRLPVYLPQRITDELINVLADFKKRASKLGVRQFVIQTHFETAMEVTPEAKQGISKLLSAGWIITNQQVFTSAASRRGHTAKLRKVLNEAGVLTYYTFSVKGFMENSNNFATNERAMQEQMEEKVFGRIPEQYYDEIKHFPDEPENMLKNIRHLEKEAGVPFLATDRNVLNLPGVGKSLTYRTIGITKDGRRILEFDHDANRRHSPIIEKMGKIKIIESKSVSEYLRQLNSMGEDISEYESVFGYSIGETEERMPIYIYPEYEFPITDEMTNFSI